MLFTTLIDLGGPLGWLAMLAPFTVLGVVLIWALFDRRPVREQRQPATEDVRPHSEVRVPVAAPEPQRAPSPPPPPHSQPAAGRTVSAPAAPPPGAPPPPVVQPAPAPPLPPFPRTASAPAPTPPAATAPSAQSDEVVRIERAIRAAVAQADEASVATLSLQLARALPQGQEQGHDVEAYLRRSIMIAMRLGDTPTHAAARLELGDRVGARGDMITACEHWQIARQIYWDGNLADGLAEADRRMIANGCPTDWVLNDF